MLAVSGRFQRDPQGVEQVVSSTTRTVGMTALAQRDNR